MTGGTALDRAVEALQDAATLADVQTIVRSAARATVQADGATFVLRDADMCFYADEDAMSPLWKGQRFPIADCISGWAMLHDEIAVVTDIEDDERIPVEAYRPTFVRSLAMVPVSVDKPIAAIGVYWADHHRVTIDELDRLAALATSTALALDRVGLQDAPFLLPGLIPDEA